MSVHAVILAGGLGSRLGHVRKADLIVDGQRLIDRVAGRLGGIDGTLLVSTGNHTRLKLPAGAIGVPDSEMQSRGPLAGIAAAASYLREMGIARDVLVSVAVDSPFLPEDYVPRLTQTPEDAAYASFGDAFYPTNAAWPLESLWSALAIHQTNAGPKSILAAIGARRVDWSQLVTEDPFASLNSLSDLIEMQRRAQKA